VADTVVLVLQPGSGDALQFMKAGILEIPDIFVVHKSDLGKVAIRTQTALTSTLSLDVSAPAPWSPPILLVSAQTGEGVDALVEAMDRHAQHLLDSGEGEARRVASRTAWAREQLVHRYGTWGLERAGGDAAVQALIAETAGTALDAFAALAGRLSAP
jgi:LAO/AO transport system kinase